MTTIQTSKRIDIFRLSPILLGIYNSDDPNPVQMTDAPICH